MVDSAGGVIMFVWRKTQFQKSNFEQVIIRNKESEGWWIFLVQIIAAWVKIEV